MCIRDSLQAGGGRNRNRIEHANAFEEGSTGVGATHFTYEREREKIYDGSKNSDTPHGEARRDSDQHREPIQFVGGGIEEE